MSPEQGAGKRWTERPMSGPLAAYSSEMLTGKRAFEGDTVSDTLVRSFEGAGLGSAHGLRRFRG